MQRIALQRIREDRARLEDLISRGDRKEANLLENSIHQRMEELIDSCPDDPQVWLDAGDMHDDLDERLACFEKVLELDPTNPEAHSEIADIYSQRGDSRFADHFDQAMRHVNDHELADIIVWLCHDTARRFGDVGRSELALAVYKKRFPK